MSVTLVIILVTVGLSWYGFKNPPIIMKLLHNSYRVHHNKEYYRLITSGFVHANFPHLLWNMFSFFFFGDILEIYFTYIFGGIGRVYFLALYILAIFVSDLPSYFEHKDNPKYNSLGASGGVAAVVFACILFQPLQEVCLYGILCLPGFIFAILYIIGSYYYAKRGKDNINHFAHIYGAIFGVVFCALLYPQSVTIFIEEIKTYRLPFL